MPYRTIYITSEAEAALYQKFRVRIPFGNYDSEKGDVGAILARLGIPSMFIGLATTIAIKNGCYSIDSRIPVGSESGIDNVQIDQPRQLAFDFLRTIPYNENVNLNPDGTRRER